MGVGAVAPGLGVDVRIAALVGMAALFAGASRAMLASAVFAFETTLQPVGLLPLLGGCSAAYLVASLMARNSIMTEKISRRGIRTPAEYLADSLGHVSVRDVASRDVISLAADDTVGKVRAWIESGAPGTSHQGFPVLDSRGVLLGVLTRRNLVEPTAHADQKVRDLIVKLPKFVYDDCTVREAVDHMVNHGVGRLPVVRRQGGTQVIGMLTRSDVLSVYQMRLKDTQRQTPTLRVLPHFSSKRGTPADQKSVG
jgi:CBS domain-containing protein